VQFHEFSYQNRDWNVILHITRRKRHNAWVIARKEDGIRGIRPILPSGSIRYVGVSGCHWDAVEGR
jgi:hypothetical protein